MRPLNLVLTRNPRHRQVTGGAAGAARALLYLRALRRPLSSPRLSPASLGRPDDRMVFVFGSPRSGTTFLAGAIGSLPGFVDLGEVHPLKSALPELARLDPVAAAPRLGIPPNPAGFGMNQNRPVVQNTPVGERRELRIARGNAEGTVSGQRVPDSRKGGDKVIGERRGRRARAEPRER